MFFPTSAMVVLGLTSYASAHMLLAKPQPFSGLRNGPLNADGSDFPCQLMFTPAGATTSMALGSTQPLAFTGQATHGGGSCQVSITYDKSPTKDSVFRVIHSIEGGCPTKNNAGNVGGEAGAADPDTYSFTVPTDLPTGPAILAWTWFNKVGNREMYMNCAPIDITGGSSKRSEEEQNMVRDILQLLERDQAAYNALPLMFTANIRNIGNDGCNTTEKIDTVFPNPGSSVDRPGLQALYGPPTGTCVGASGSSGSSGSGPSAVSAAAPASTSVASQGGVFATLPAGGSAIPTTMAVSTTAPAAATSAAPVAATSAAPVASASHSPPPSSGATGAMTAGSACTTEGLWNCIGGTSFQQCASGTWSVVESLAAGTKCTPGQTSAIAITAAKAKRGIRFSSEHVRRHIHRSA